MSEKSIDSILWQLTRCCWSRTECAICEGSVEIEIETVLAIFQKCVKGVDQLKIENSYLFKQ